MNVLNFIPFPNLTTERLQLRKLKPSDDKLIFEYQSNKENFEYVDMPVYTSIVDAQEYIEKMNKGVDSNRWIIWAITEKDTGSIIGTISIWNISKEKSKAELGFGLYAGSISKGFMTEALNEVISFGLNKMGLETIEAYTNKHNVKSRALLENNNFTKIGSVTEENTVSGLKEEMVIYKYSQND